MADNNEVKVAEAVQNADVVTKENSFKDKKPFNKDKKGDRKGTRAPRREDSEFENRVVSVRRVTKVVKGGRNLRFSALVVVGDHKGKVGIGIGKGKEPAMAISKAETIAKKNLKVVPIVDGTVPHETIGKFSSTNIIMLPAKPGTGVIAGGAARSVLELAGYKDIVTKIHGSSNKINCVKATINGLGSMRTKEEIAARRGKSVDEI